jgi:hypothetical protein
MDWELCAVSRCEAPHILEWLAYYKILGCSQVHLYEGLGDDTRDRIDFYVKEGFVNFIPWPVRPGQHQAYRDYIINHRARNPWTLIVDTDEFLVPTGNETITEFLSSFGPDVASISIGWLIFGHAGRLKRPKEHNGSTLLNYTRCVDNDKHPHLIFTKAFIRPGYCADHVHDPHFFDALPHYRTVREDGSPMHWGDHHWRKPEHFPVERMRLNHYFTRSLEDYCAKLARGSADGNIRCMDDFIGHNEVANELHDVEILKYADLLKDEMKRIGAWSRF